MAVVVPAAPVLPSPLVPLRDERLGDVRLLLKRDDLIGSDLGGNKWRKLRYLVDDARSSRFSTMLTFGGAYSNHVRALAAAGRLFGFRTIGVIRGDERPMNPSLARAVELGMTLHYIDRSTYRRKRDPEFIAQLRDRFGAFYLVPEGGTTPFAVRGCAEIVAEITEAFDLICCPVGTGGTLAGLSTALDTSRRARGYAVLRAASLDGEVAELQRVAIGHHVDNWDIDHRWHCGGFARRNAQLDRFVSDFRSRHDIELDAVYVAKMLLGLFASVAAGEIAAGTTVVAVITGSRDPAAPTS